MVVLPRFRGFQAALPDSGRYAKACVRRKVMENAPVRTRTSNPRFRRPMLYPIELRMHVASGTKSGRLLQRWKLSYFRNWTQPDGGEDSRRRDVSLGCWVGCAGIVSWFLSRGGETRRYGTRRTATIKNRPEGGGIGGQASFVAFLNLCHLRNLRTASLNDA